MLAQKDAIIEEASDTIYHLTQEEQIRQQCEARADFLYWQRRRERYIQELEEELAQKDALLATTIAEKDALLAENSTTITEKDALLAATIAEKDSIIAEKDALIAKLQT